MLMSTTHNTKPNNGKTEKQEMCSWSEEFKVHVHRFDMSAAFCRCRQQQATEYKFKTGGWRVK